MKSSEGSKLYSVIEVYKITYESFLFMGKFMKGRKNNLISTHFIERIMLAVTEVNDCPVCSYGHTKMAIESGMSTMEIENMLMGEHESVPSEELPAIMFAQHYAEYRGKPTRKAYEGLVKAYGKKKAESIVGAIKVIMMGNVLGIPWGSFINRFKGNPDPRSTVLYELTIVIATFFFIPVALVHVLLVNLFSKK